MAKDIARDRMISILHENCDLTKDNNTKLPYTAYVTEYVVDGETRYDLAMAHSVTDIFDVYYDKYKKDFISMKQSEGRIAPARWNVNPPSEPKKKRRRKRKESEDE